MAAYFNEIDPYAAEWLRTLILVGLIAPGEVDERSVEDVTPGDLRGYTQCHFFAGIGGWALALQLAGWPDDRPVWTGSCPCQPFSAAGQGRGHADERHLWPAWHHLIAECRPPVIFGEQVEAAIKHGWLDLVQTDLEALDYACGAICLPAASVGAPHGRSRLWFVGHTDERGGRRNARAVSGTEGRAERQVWGQPDSAEPAGVDGFVGHPDDTGPQGRSLSGTTVFRSGAGERTPWAAGTVEWLPCRDGKARPTQPGLFPLSHGVPTRVGRLRAYGNAIVPQVAAEVIETFMEYRP